MSRSARKRVDRLGVQHAVKPIDAFARRAWNYVAVGAGHDAKWWKEFFSVVRMSGYDDEISLEMEDLTLSMLDGHLASLHVLREALNID